MANKWYYKHGSLLPNGVVVNAPDDNVVGNVVYVDQNHPNASDAAANKGCANVPYKTYTAFMNNIAVGGIGIFAKGNYTINVDVSSGEIVIGDTLFDVVIQSESTTKAVSWGSFYNIVFKNVITYFGRSNVNRCLYDSTCVITFLTPSKCIFLCNVSAGEGGSFNVNILNNALSINGLHYNCVPPTQTAASAFYNKVFWLGTLNLNTFTSDLNTICPLIGTTYPTENDAIAKVETDLGLAANTLKNNGFRLLNPHFINPLKGNFNIDFLNYDCTAILALRDSWGWIINRGVRCEYPTDFVGAVGAGFGEEPNVSDGFNGALYSRNINSSGAITNTAYDTVLVSKKYILPRAYTLEDIKFFNKILGNAFELNATENEGTDTPNCYTYYFIGVKAGTLESVFNSSNNTFSYSTGVLTCDFPRFMWNRSTQLNKDDNTIYGQIENGTFDLDYMRNIYKAGVKEFRIIAVKKGV